MIPIRVTHTKVGPGFPWSAKDGETVRHTADGPGIVLRRSFDGGQTWAIFDAPSPFVHSGQTCMLRQDCDVYTVDVVATLEVG